MNINNLSAAINEMVEQMKKSAEVAREASQNSSEETVKLADSREKTSQLMEAIQEINSKSDQIGSIIQTMDDMAEQTNILAINAMIEAARAGSAGKSFAVVANEVATLANKSAEASQGIADLIEETLHAVSKCVSLAGETEQLQNAVEEKARQTDTLMQDIVRSTTEEVKRSETITSELEEISAVVQHTSATAEESSAASQQLSEQAELLKDMVSKFKLN